MAATIKASSQGLIAADIARRHKGWTKRDTRLTDTANVSIATLKRFWVGDAITQDAFVEICKALGVDWQKITELGSGYLQKLLDEGVEVWNQWKSLNPPLGYKFDDVNLSNAEFEKVDFSNTSLVRAKLDGANLRQANFSYADLTNANLSGANLRGVNLSRAFLMGANLNGADLEKADLSRADLTNVNLSRANLRGANLNATQALSTIFTGAILTGACLQDWNINESTRLENAICDYIYLQYIPSISLQKFRERRPRNGSFALGEFAVLFQKALETVDLIFADGIDWKAFFKSFQELKIKYGDENLAIQAIDKKPGNAFVIRLEVPSETDKANLEFDAKYFYQEQIKLLETKYKAELTLQKQEVEHYRQQQVDLQKIIQMMAEKHTKAPTTILNIGGDIHGSVNIQSDNQDHSNVKFEGDIHGSVNIQEVNHNQNLQEAAAEIQQLLYQLEDINPTTEIVRESVYKEIKQNPPLKGKLQAALSTGGIEALKALKQYLSHPAANFVIGALEDWQKMNGSRD